MNRIKAWWVERNIWERQPEYTKKKYNYVTSRHTVRKLSIPWFGLTFTIDRGVDKKFEDWTRP